jgi:8-oxo-dGTP pyrophosphatase MutT (NUDIX family)
MSLPSDVLAPFAVEDFLRRASLRLHREPPDEVANPFVEGTTLPETQHQAAVLVPLVRRGEEAFVLFTVRAATLPRHAGQISFPGGRIDPGDADAGAAALREAWEEIGVGAAHITPLGFLDIYLAASGFRITPLVALIDPAARLALNPGEVDEVFEVPLADLMRAEGYATDEEHPRGRIRRYFVFHHGERRIWGITAGILRNLHERLYAP